MVAWHAIGLVLHLKEMDRKDMLSHCTYPLLQLKQKFDEAQKQVKELISQLQLLQTKV